MSDRRARRISLPQKCGRCKRAFNRDETVFVRVDDHSDAICGRCWATDPAIEDQPR